VAILRQIPVDQAVLMALHLEKEEEQTFRINLAKRVFEGPKDVDKRVSEGADDMKWVAGIVVKALAEHYEWTNVAILQVDWSNACIRLLSQWAAETKSRLPEGYTQRIQDGVLGYVCREGCPVRIGDVKGPEWKDIFRPGVPGTVSELCVPIRGEDGQVRWLLDVEDIQQNAFAEEEQQALETVLAELAAVLERSRQHHFLQVVIQSTSDAIIVTDERGNINKVNPAAQRLLGYSEEELLGRMALS
jgi:PAS domain-containing protein